MTLPEAKSLLVAAEVRGLKPPPAITTPEGFRLAVELYAADCTAAGLDLAAAAAALAAYAQEPQADAYPKPFPTVGHLVARTPAFRERTQVAAAADGYLDLVLRHRASVGPLLDGPEGPFTLNPGASEAVEAATWAGIEALGGWDALGALDPKRLESPRRTFREAFRAALVAAPLQPMLTAAQAPQLGQQSRHGDGK